MKAAGCGKCSNTSNNVITSGCQSPGIDSSDPQTTRNPFSCKSFTGAEPTSTPAASKPNCLARARNQPGPQPTSRMLALGLFDLSQRSTSNCAEKSIQRASSRLGLASASHFNEGTTNSEVAG